MKQIYKKLSAFAMSAILLCGTVTAVSAQSRVIVRQLSPQCATERCTGREGRQRKQSCPATKSCPDQQGCQRDQCESLCDLLSRCGLSAKQCEELGRLMQQTGNCPGNTAADETDPTEAPEPTQTPASDPGESPAAEPTEAQTLPPTEPSEEHTEAFAPTEKPTVPPNQHPTESPTDILPSQPTEASHAEPTEAQDESYTLNAYEKEVITRVNIIRHENGLGYLGADAQLSRVARIKSQDMRENGYFSHTSPTYGSPFEMLQRFGVSYRTAGENIAMGYRTPQQVVDGWMNSPGHRANILNKNYTRIGVGYVADGNYWTQLFAG